MRHEVHLTLRGMRALVPIGLGLVALGAIVAGGRGAASAALGAGLVAANQAAAALSTGWARTLTPGVLAIGYTGFVVRMFGVFAAFAVLATMPWIHDALLAAAFCACLFVTLGAEMLAYTRTTYVPAWRRRGVTP